MTYFTLGLICFGVLIASVIIYGVLVAKAEKQKNSTKDEND